MIVRLKAALAQQLGWDTTSEFFLREAFALSTDPGTGPKQTMDVPVNSKVACPDRPFTPFGIWRMTFCPGGCDDGNECTTDSFDPEVGCMNTPKTAMTTTRVPSTPVTPTQAVHEFVMTTRGAIDSCDFDGSCSTSPRDDNDR